MTADPNSRKSLTITIMTYKKGAEDTNINVVLFDGQIECQSCHQLGGEETIAAQAHYPGELCRECHPLK